MSKVKSRAWLLANILLAGVGISSVALSQPSTLTFDIPAEALSAALHDFSKISGRQIIFTDDLVFGKTAAPLQGSFTPSEALSRLLEGTDLVVDSSSSSGLMIRRKGAQKQSQELPQVEEVEVTATRVARAGFSAPTPTTVLNKADLQAGGSMSIGEALYYLPSQINAFTPTTQSGNATGSGYFVNLRGLGSARALTLVDGQRPVLTSSTSFDLSLIPISMVQRIDTVTGGASAAWGSDAVAGVVNIILDRNFEGQRASVEFGAPVGTGGGQEWKADFAIGAAFGDNDRGHFMIGGEYVDQQAIHNRGTANPRLNWGYISNPAYTATNGQPQQLLVQSPYYSNASQGGLITAGPLAGTAFGPGGTPYQFQYGTYRTAANMSGGDPSASTIYNTLNLSAPIIEKSVLANATYDVLDNVKLKASFLYGSTTSSEPSFPNYQLGTITIQSGNPFIPASIQQQMTARGLTALTMGRINTDYGFLNLNTNVTLLQSTMGAEGSFTLGSRWDWDVYYSYGRSKNAVVAGPQLINDLYAQSLDAVASPTTGKPVCRITLTNPTSACVPVNIFGYGSPSAAALSYFEGTASYQTTLSQNDIAGTVHGEPFSLWAGPVSFAAGGEFRRLANATVSDALSGANRFNFLNTAALFGNYSVGEGFIESVVPLIKDLPLARELDFNGAFRLSEYNRAGEQKTWKLGITDDVTSELRLRGTVSQDIRAPNISELFSVNTLGISSTLNPFTNQTNLISTLSGGNPNLQPEQAHTTTFGGSYQPEWVPGLRMSVDWYSIDIHNDITTLSAGTILTDCFRGQVNLCGNITPNPLITPNAVVSSVNSTAVNVGKVETSGIDIEVDHRLDLSAISQFLAGVLNSRLLVNYTDKFLTIVGPNVTTSFLPKWKGALFESYMMDQWKFDLRMRYVGSIERLNTITSNYNHFADETYIDFGVEYALTSDRKWVVYGNLTDLFDRTVPLGFSTIGNQGIYNSIGRSYNIGVRAAF